MTVRDWVRCLVWRAWLCQSANTLRRELKSTYEYCVLMVRLIDSGLEVLGSKPFIPSLRNWLIQSVQSQHTWKQMGVRRRPKWWSAPMPFALAVRVRFLLAANSELRICLESNRHTSVRPKTVFKNDSNIFWNFQNLLLTLSLDHTAAFLFSSLKLWRRGFTRRKMSALVPS